MLIQASYAMRLYFKRTFTSLLVIGKLAFNNLTALCLQIYELLYNIDYLPGCTLNSCTKR